MSKLLFKGNISPETELVVVIMAGGSGTRFWPLSRQDNPKQFLNFVDGEKSLIQLTAERLSSLPINTSLIVSCGEHHEELVNEHLVDAAILAEPLARNTAACLAYAAFEIEARLEKSVPMLCLPADHLIGNVKQFHKIILAAIEGTKEQKALGTIGIEPSKPEIGYGYIKFDKSSFREFNDLSSHKVQKFVEKPHLEKAKEYVESGDYYWNSGMFIWESSTLLENLKEHFPRLHAGLYEVYSKNLIHSSPDEHAAAIREAFPKLDSESIDTGLMEKADNVIMFLGQNLDWSDVGAWDAWLDTANKSIIDQDNNVSFGEVEFINSKGCSVYSENKFVAALGLEDLVIVETKDALLVCPRDKSQDVKKIIEKLKSENKMNLL